MDPIDREDREMQEFIETVELPEVDVVAYGDAETYFEPVAAYCSSSHISC